MYNVFQCCLWKRLGGSVGAGRRAAHVYPAVAQRPLVGMQIYLVLSGFALLGAGACCAPLTTIFPSLLYHYHHNTFYLAEGGKFDSGSVSGVGWVSCSGSGTKPACFHFRRLTGGLATDYIS